MAKGKKKSVGKNGGSVSVSFGEKMKRHRVKVYIPAYYEMIFGKEILMSTLRDAIIGLNVWHYHIEPEDGGDGAYLCLFNKDSFPEVEDDQPTPDATLWYSASESKWLVQWQQCEEGQVLLPSGNIIEGTKGIISV
jgi:hypothetical protein